jgi:hypothetical protein
MTHRVSFKALEWMLESRRLILVSINGKRALISIAMKSAPRDLDVGLEVGLCVSFMLSFRSLRHDVCI